MSKETVERTYRGFQLFVEGGLDSLINEGLVSPNVVWDFTRSGVVGLGVYEGAEACKTMLDDWFASTARLFATSTTTIAPRPSKPPG